MTKNIICFLTVRPCILSLQFYKKLKNENTDIYICIDDNNYNIPKINELEIIQINNTICERSGFKSTVQWMNNKSCSRDKALYYFCKNNISFQYLWLIEEDVFIPNINTIENLNKKYITGDLLTASNNIIYEKKINIWHWNHINSQIRLSPPYGSSMICACRVSKRLLNGINAYANKFKNLFMDEALFNTICLHFHLDIICPNELSSIVHRRKWSTQDIQECNLYHPIKNIQKQYEIREQFKNHAEHISQISG